ncbi:MAG: glycosyltransferase family 2 protein [Alphaproteobacteria bacterium]
MTKNKVTIVIPTFNRANYVAKTIDSALSQSVNCDIVVCDHGSKDNTQEVMKIYDGLVKYIRREDDFGPHFCWLEGILHAKTEFIHIHFDDDLMEPTFIEETLKLMTDKVGMVFSEAKIFDINSQKVAHENIFHLKDKLNHGINDSKVLEKLLFNGLMLSPACCLYRKKELVDGLYQGDLPLDFGGNYHGVGPDHFFSFLAVMRYPKFGFVDKSLAIFGSHDGSITIDASSDPEKSVKLQNGYEALRNYCRLINLYKNNNSIKEKIKKKNPLLKRIIRSLKLFLKAIGLRKKGVK